MNAGSGARGESNTFGDTEPITGDNEKKKKFEELD